MDFETAQALLAAVGTDDAPSVEQLTEARSAFVAAAKTAKSKGDRESLAAMLEAMKVADLAITEAQELEAKASAELDALTDGLPEFEAEEPTVETPEETPVAEKPAGKMLSVAEAAARLGLAQPGPAAVVTEREPVQTLTLGGERRDDATWGDMGAAFSRASKSMLRGGRTTLATFNTEFDHKLTGKIDGNTRVLDSLSDRAGEEAVTAAGGCCSLAEPIRDQPMLASLARPIADALPTVGTSAGKVSFFAPICLPQGGVGTWTCDQDAAVDPDDESTWKECYEVACDEPQEVTVEAIYTCLTIGNFQQRFAPEQWNAVLHAAAAMQARTAEVALFNQIANSEFTTTHTVTDTGSIYVTLAQTLVTAAATIRQNQRYVGRRIKVILPEWVKDAVDADLIARAAVRGRAIESESIDVFLAARGIDLVWSPDIDPIEADGQSDGPLSEFPDEAGAVMFVDGGAFRLDGGELNLGTDVRDHDLNRQNKVAAFSESFEAAVVRSCDSKALTIPVTVCDAAACLGS